ncbi:MAG: DUF2017 domain-containing protein [Streptosporangiaceae bacterium]
MSGFRASSGGVTARFAKPEAIVIRDLVTQVIELVAGDDADPAAGAGPRPAAPGGGLPDIPDVAELEAMVGLGAEADLPDDPVLARLLPDAYREDPEAAREFRRFTESGLRSAKVAAARTLLATLPPGGGKVRLSAEQAEQWLRTLNDVRLALGVRLGVTDDFDALSDTVPPGDSRYAYVQIYQWLAYVQGSLVAALS